MPRIVPEMTRRARAMRTEPTPAERAIWLRIRTHRPRFTRQLVVGPYILDLACRSAKLAVEFDGSQHFKSEYDSERDAFLNALGWRVLRFWNSDVLANPDGIAAAIAAAVSRYGEATHPRPLPSREGRR